MVLNMDNASEPYPIECNSPPITDVWCPAGSLSEDIPFHRCVFTRVHVYVSECSQIVERVSAPFLF